MRLGLSDWVQRVCNTGAGVHTKFWGGIRQDSLRERVLSTLNRLYDTEPRPILLTGHSLGGCEALLFGAWAQKVQSDYEWHVVTFGQLRTGDAAFVQWVQAALHDNAKFKYTRYVNCNDMAPRIPAMSVGYRQDGLSLRYIDSNFNIHPYTEFEARNADTDCISLVWGTQISRIWKRRPVESRIRWVLRFAFAIPWLLICIPALGYGTFVSDHFINDYDNALFAQVVTDAHGQRHAQQNL